MSIAQFSSALKSEFNKVETENGGYGYKTTNSPIVDFFYRVSSYRSADIPEIIKDFDPVLSSKDLETGMRLVFFIGDIREGLGERRLFNTLLFHMAEKNPEAMTRLAHLVPDYSRWDYLFTLRNTECEPAMWQILHSQLHKDLANMKAGKPISLLAKWLPSCSTSCKATRELGRIVRLSLGMSPRMYRKMLSSMRAYIKVVERDMSANRWDEIAYEHVPSKANLNYRNAFLRHDTERRKAYLEALSKGVTSINSSTLFPYEIVYKYDQILWSVDKDDSLEALWNALPDWTQGLDTGSTLCMADGSGSMHWSRVSNASFVKPVDVANSLALYFAPKLRGPLKDTYLTFSRNPQLVDLSRASTLRDRLALCLEHNECENTDIAKAFDLVLQLAVQHHMSQEDIPSNILVLSDMEFDDAVECRDSHGRYLPKETVMDIVARRWAEAGYKFPRLVFWNICNRSGAIPMIHNENGVALVSGFSPVIASMLFSGKLDPEGVLMEKLMSPRYDAIGEQLAL